MIWRCSYPWGAVTAGKGQECVFQCGHSECQADAEEAHQSGAELVVLYAFFTETLSALDKTFCA